MEEANDRLPFRRRRLHDLRLFKRKTLVARSRRSFELTPSEIEDWVEEAKAARGSGALEILPSIKWRDLFIDYGDEAALEPCCAAMALFMKAVIVSIPQRKAPSSLLPFRCAESRAAT